MFRYTQFLFHWGDIRRTKDVLHNIIRLYFHSQADEILSAKEAFNAEIENLKHTLSVWANTDLSSLDDTLSKPAESSASDPSKGQTSGSQLLAHHFRHNAADLTMEGEEHTLNLGQDIIDDLLSQEGAVLSTTYDHLKELAKNFGSMSIQKVLTKLLEILTEAVLDSAKVVVDAILNVLSQIIHSAVDLLDAKIHIPVISDILNAIGVPDISFLDLFTWIAAVGYTVVYKIVEGEAPFADTNDIRKITSAKSWSELAALFGRESSSPAAAVNSNDVVSTSSILPQVVQQTIFQAGHSASGFFVFNNNFLKVNEGLAPIANPFSTPSAIVGGIAAAMQGATDFLVPKYPVRNRTVAIISKVTLGATLTSVVLFWGPVQNRLGARKSWFAVGDGRATGSVVNSFLVVPAFCVTGLHFCELSQEPVSIKRSAAIVGEVSNMTSYVSRIAYMAAVNDYEPESRAVTIGIMGVSNLATAGLQTAEAFLSKEEEPEKCGL